MFGLTGSRVTSLPGGPADRRRLARALAACACIAVTCILALCYITSLGSHLSAPARQVAAAARAGSGSSSDLLFHVLLALVVIVAVSRATGALFRYFKQPPVVGEMVAGIMLGPSLLGHTAPAAMSALFPAAVVAPLGVIANVGVLLFMFLIGVELNTQQLRERTTSTLLISNVSIACPLVLGSVLALYLYPRLSSANVPFAAFALFVSVSMAVTAFPVLARILLDRGLVETRLGAIAITSAAVDDVTAWCLLALVVGVVHARLGSAAVTAALTAAYVITMFTVVRPLLHRTLIRYDEAQGPTQRSLAVVFVLLLVSCLTTEMIGIHALFGAFLFGAMIPKDSMLGRALVDKLEDFVVVLLLPAFFAYTGLRTQIGLIDSSHWLICALVILVAFGGKLGGSAVVARLSGLSWRDSGAIGVLMNTRGLMELIVLNVGLELGVVSPTLFAIMVVMALVTTAATSPILDLLMAGQRSQASNTLTEPEPSIATA